VKRVTTVSVETMQLVKSLPEFRPLLGETETSEAGVTS